jgi:hypothetical protein
MISSRGESGRQDLAKATNNLDMLSSTNFRGGFGAAPGSFPRPAGAGKKAYNPYRRPASMPGVPYPYPEAIRDVEDVDGMWDVLT